MTNGNPTDRDTLTKELDDRLRGTAFAPGQAGYEEARSLWNGMVDHRPAVVARCRGAADVMAAVSFAAEHDLPVGVRGGAHSFSGKTVPDGGLLIDSSLMGQVRVDPGARRARVGPGATWGDFDHEAQAFGLATTGGVDSRTGVAGLTLGGGIGWLARSYGLACDNVRSVDLVTAGGELVRASEDENPDLFWGVRGGGQELGVVTSFEFELHEVGPEILVAQIFHPMESATEALRAYRDFMAEAPDEVGCYALFVRVPPVAPFPESHHGKTALAIVGCHSGSVEEGRAAYEELSAFGDPILNAVQPMPYTALQQAFNAGYPDGERYYGKSCYFDEISDEVIDLLVDRVDPLAGSFTGVYFEAMGGAVNEPDPDATAFPHRDAPYNFGMTIGWSDPADDEEMMGWGRGLYEAMAPHGTGAVYVNYLDHDEGDRIPNAYGDNYQRLRELKTQWDPDGLFGR